MDRKPKKLPALALASAMLCAGAFQTAAANDVIAPTPKLPANGAYFTFPVKEQSKSLGDELHAYFQFCENYPQHCVSIERQDTIITLTAENWNKIQDIIGLVRSKMKIVDDFKKYKLTGQKDKHGNDLSPDVWTEGEDDQGDCEDFVLRWSRELKQGGFPASAILKTFMQSSEKETLVKDGKKYEFLQGHMVLTMRTNRGDFIADVLKPEIYALSALDKKWDVKLVESPRNMTHFFQPDIVNPAAVAYSKVQDRFPAPRYANAGGD